MLADVDLHAPVARLRHSVLGRHQGLALSASGHGDPISRDAKLHELIPHPAGSPERERIVGWYGADAVGVADDDDLGRRPAS